MRLPPGPGHFLPGRALDEKLAEGVRPIGAALRSWLQRVDRERSTLHPVTGLAFSMPASPGSLIGKESQEPTGEFVLLGRSWKGIWPFLLTCSCIWYWSPSFCYCSFPSLASKAVVLKVWSVARQYQPRLETCWSCKSRCHRNPWNQQLL